MKRKISLILCLALTVSTVYCNPTTVLQAEAAEASVEIITEGEGISDTAGVIDEESTKQSLENDSMVSGGISEQETEVSEIPANSTISDLFPDAAFAEVVAQELSKSVGDDVTDVELKSIETLSGYNGWYIQSVEGIEYLTNLTSFILYYAAARGSSSLDISQLSSLTKLVNLNLTGCGVTDISALANLSNLEELTLDSNRINDISALRNLTKLKELSFMNNQVKDISALSNLINIEVLQAYDNKISDIESLSNLTNLIYLDMSKNQISDISALGNLVSLQTLDLSSNNIADVSKLSNYPELTELYIGSNQISDISNLKAYPELQFIDLSGNEIADISRLSQFPSLQRVNLNSNHISDISSLSDLPKLYQIYAMYQTIYLPTATDANSSMTIDNPIKSLDSVFEIGGGNSKSELEINDEDIKPSGSYNKEADTITFNNLSIAESASFTFSHSGKFENVYTTYAIWASFVFSGTVIQPYTTEVTNTDVEKFVMRLYETVLGRTADAQGLNTWTTGLNSGKHTGASVVQAFYNSAEYKNKNTGNADFVESVYKTMLGRGSDTSGKANWLGCLTDGVSRTYVLKGFVGSTEFTNLCKQYGIERGSITLTEYRDKNINVTRFVQRLYGTCLGRTADTQGLNTWTKGLITGIHTGASVVLSFYNSSEYKNKNTSNSDFVESAYKTMLNRGSDAAGKANWLGCLTDGVSRTYVIKGFVGSNEFTNLCKQYGIEKGSITLTEYRDKNINTTRFVQRLYSTCLGRTADTQGLNAWTEGLITGSHTGASVVWSFYNSNEYKGKKASNETFVESVYKTMLNRSSDAEGKANWVNYLKQGYSRKYVLSGFVGSSEFTNLCKTYGVTRGSIAISSSDKPAGK